MSIRFAVEPRLVPVAKAARRLHLTVGEFREVRDRLRGEGFPAPCPHTGHYDLVAIDAWLDRRAGLATARPVSVDHDAVIRSRLDALG
ncbi:MAG: hypothetical protein KF723_22800 [Rhizobiaceae bacterium]|nr:hypothetical protein [Rhizobiaceae bacterium]